MARISTLALALAAAIAAPAAAQIPIDGSWSVAGAIEDGDPLVGEHRQDEYRLRLEAGRPYRFRAASAEFDIFLRLVEEGANRQIVSDDDSGGGTNSFFYHRPVETGIFLLQVRPLSADGRGSYTVSVEAAPAPPPPSRSPPGARGRSEWMIWSGELDRGDPDRDGRYFEDYLLLMEAGETRFISVESADFDPMVWIVRGPGDDSEPIDLDDDAGPGFNALLGHRADRRGEYIVRVMAFRQAEIGRYRLRISNPISPAVEPGRSERPSGR